MDYRHYYIIIFLLTFTLAKSQDRNHIPDSILVKKAIEQAVANRPDLATDYSCLLFEKTQFRTGTTSDSTLNNDLFKVFSTDQSDLLLIEDLSNIKHLKPDKTLKSRITGRVSGQNDPALSLIAYQVEPFVIYNQKLGFLNQKFINPISTDGLNFYTYKKETNDTLADDHVTHITFHPKNENSETGLTGSFQIQDSSLGIVKISVEVLNKTAPVWFSLTQDFQLIENRVWFPKEQTVFLTINAGNSSPQMVVKSANYITSAKLNPAFDENSFSTKNMNTPVSPIQRQELNTNNQVRAQQDRSPFYLIDSLRESARKESLERLQKQLIEGYIPVGYLKIDYKKLIDYNEFEGLKLGLGIWTSNKVSGLFETGGYYVHSFKRDDDKYGAGINFNINRTSETKLSFLWKDDYDETGSFSFLDGYLPNSPESFRRFLTESMDRSESVNIGLQSKLTTNLKGEVFFSRKDVVPETGYRFYNQDTLLQAPFRASESGLKLKWGPSNQKTNHFSTNIWLNTTYGNGSGPSGFEYTKHEFQLQETWRQSAKSVTTIRFTGGMMFGDFPSSSLYSAFGSYKKIGLEVPYTFGTMRLNEFAADRFACIFLNQRINLFTSNKGSFKPQLDLVTNFAQGDVANKRLSGNTNSFNKPYLESGIVVNKLYSISLIDYGFSVYYRYGSYRLNHEPDNWAFKFAIKFNIG